MNEILKAISDFIFIQDEPVKADAIMTLGGSSPEIPETAAQLWKKGFAPIVLTGGKYSITTGKFKGPSAKREIYSGEYETECDFYMDVLLRNGVPKEAVYCERESTYTKENAVFARKLTQENHLEIKKALLVCKAFHARRSLMYYQSAFPDMKFYVITFDAYGISKDNWYKTQAGAERVLGELRRCGEQFEFEDMCNYW